MIRAVYIKPLDNISHVNDSNSETGFPVKALDGKKLHYGISSQVPKIAGNIGLKIRLFDKVGYRNHVAIYSLRVFIDDKPLYRVVFDRIKKQYTHRSGLYYDYLRSTLSDFTYYLYHRSTGRGVIKVQKDRTYKIRIECLDANNNRSTLSFSLAGEDVLNEPAAFHDANLERGFPLELFSADRICRVYFSRRSALYDEMITLDTAGGADPWKNLILVSDVYTLHPFDLCLDRPVRVRIKYNGSDYRKVGVYFSRAGTKRARYIGNDYDRTKGEFSFSAARMGNFFLIRDDVPPKVVFPMKRYLRLAGKKGKKKNSKLTLRKGQPVRFYVHDPGSGIDLNAVTLQVDDADVKWDYDPDRRYIEILQHNKIWEKGEHVIRIMIRDRAGNSSNPLKVSYSI